MGKRVATAILVTLLFISVYGGFWIIQSKRADSILQTALVTFAKEFGGSRSEFLYTKSKVSGFPFSFRVTISKPKLWVRDEDLTFDLVSEEDMQMTANIIGTRFKVLLPKNITIDLKNPDTQETWLAQFNSNPSILAEAGTKSVWPWVAGKSHDPFELTTQVRYQDDGYVITRSESTSKIASATSSSLYFEAGGAEQAGMSNILADITALHIAVLDNYSSDEEPLGPLTIKADVSYAPRRVVADAKDVVDPNANMAIRDLSLESKLFSIKVKGTVGEEENDAIPYGDLQVTLGQYVHLVDYGTSLINYVVRNSAFPLFQIKPKQASAFKMFLSDMASEKYNDDKDVLMVLKRSQGDPLWIGEYNFYDALQKFKRRGQPLDPQPKEGQTSASAPAAEGEEGGDGVEPPSAGE